MHSLIGGSSPFCLEGTSFLFRFRVRPEGPKPEARRAESGLGFGAGEASSLPHQLEDLGSAASSPSGVRGRALAAKRSYCIPEVPDGLLELDEANFEGGGHGPLKCPMLKHTILAENLRSCESHKSRAS